MTNLESKEPWETTTRYGRADLTLHPLVHEAYKVACLIERCGASVELTRASSTAFDLCEKLSMELAASRDLFNKGIGVLKENRFNFSFENAEEAERAFHWVADLGTLQTSQPPKHPDPSDESDPCVSHIAMKEYEKALERIIGLSDLEMRDGDGAREIARRALNGLAEPPAPPELGRWGGSQGGLEAF